MKRDMDLVRLLLLITEEEEDSFDPREHKKLEKYTDSLIVYHVELLQNKGLIDCQVQCAMGGICTVCQIDALTWDGLDYLDAIRDEKVWKKTVKLVKDTVGSTTIESIKQAAIMVTMNMLSQAISA